MKPCPRCGSTNYFEEPDRTYCLMCGYSEWNRSAYIVTAYEAIPKIPPSKRVTGYIAQNSLNIQYTGRKQWS